MPYATLSHVQARTPLRVFSATSVPSASQVAMFLDDTAAELDAMLQAAGYQLPVPVTATVALRLLQNVNTVGAWALVEEAAPVGKDAERARKEWARLQAQLDPHGKGASLELPGVPRQADSAYAAGGRTTSGASPVSPVFSLDPCDW